MSFESYDALKSEIQSFLWDRSDVAAKIPTFITLAETEMKRLLRTQQCVLSRPFSLSSNIAAIPTNGRSIRAVQLVLPQADETTFDLDYVTPEQMASWSVSSAAQPRFYTIEGGRLKFFPTPEQGYTGTIHYRGVLDALGATNPTNWVLEEHPDIYLAGALKYAKLWLIDADQDWSSMFYGAIQQANRDQPMIQTNTTLRADAVSTLGRNGGYDIYSDSYGGLN